MTKDMEDLEYHWSSITTEHSLENLNIACKPKIDSTLEWKPTNFNFGLVPLRSFVYHNLESGVCNKLLAGQLLQ